MTVTAEAAMVAAALAVAAGLVLSPLIAAGWRPVRRRRAVLVALRTGETLRGVLVARRPTYIVLAKASAVGSQVQPIDGTVEVDRDNVTWVQVLP